jgi:SOS-response transcriptional repressor LexA
MFRCMGVQAPLKRDQALAFIIDRIARSGVSPSLGEIASALGVSDTRAKELVKQLIALRLVEHTPGTQRSLRVRDVATSRTLLDRSLRHLGWSTAGPMEKLAGPFPKGQLPTLPPFEHLPDID